MIHNIEYEYEGGIEPEDERKILFFESLQIWLGPHSEQINRQNGKLVFYFSADGFNKFRLEDVDDETKLRIARQFPKFSWI